MIFLAYVLAACVLLGGVVMSLCPSWRRRIDRWDALKIVGCWTFFTNEPEALFVDVVVTGGAEQGGGACLTAVSLGGASFPAVMPVLHPWRRYWKVVADHALRSRVGGPPEQAALQGVAAVLAGLPEAEPQQVRVVDVYLSEVQEPAA